jgi:hypothetical protein
VFLPTCWQKNKIESWRFSSPNISNLQYLKPLLPGVLFDEKPRYRKSRETAPLILALSTVSRDKFLLWLFYVTEYADNLNELHCPKAIYNLTANIFVLYRDFEYNCSVLNRS